MYLRGEEQPRSWLNLHAGLVGQQHAAGGRVDVAYGDVADGVDGESGGGERADGASVGFGVGAEPVPQLGGAERPPRHGARRR